MNFCVLDALAGAVATANAATDGVLGLGQVVELWWALRLCGVARRVREKLGQASLVFG